MIQGGPRAQLDAATPEVPVEPPPSQQYPSRDVRTLDLFLTSVLEKEISDQEFLGLETPMLSVGARVNSKEPINPDENYYKQKAVAAGIKLGNPGTQEVRLPKEIIPESRRLRRDLPDSDAFFSDFSTGELDFLPADQANRIEELFEKIQARIEEQSPTDSESSQEVFRPVSRRRRRKRTKQEKKAEVGPAAQPRIIVEPNRDSRHNVSQSDHLNNSAASAAKPDAQPPGSPQWGPDDFPVLPPAGFRDQAKYVSFALPDSSKPPPDVRVTPTTMPAQPDDVSDPGNPLRTTEFHSGIEKSAEQFANEITDIFQSASPELKKWYTHFFKAQLCKLGYEAVLLEKESKK